MNDPKLNALGRKLGISPDQDRVFKRAAKKGLEKTGSSEQAGRYASHITKAALHRKMKDKKSQKGI